jgi:hypothetical protein
MITDSNHACFAKMATCGFQEEVLFFPNPAGQKSHVKAFTSKCSLGHAWKVTITGENAHKKGRSISDSC